MAKTTWNLDPAHSEITFRVKHMMIANVTGSFERFTLAVETEEEDFSRAAISFSAETASISTGNDQRDGHLRSGDFFDSEKFPHLAFVSTGLTRAGGSDYVLKGDLTIRDVTRTVELKVEFGGTGKDPWGNTRAGFTVSGSISRKDWNLVWNAPLESGGLLVSDEVRLMAEIQLVRA